MTINTLILLVLAYGLKMRRKPEVHMKVMITCFVIDVINVGLVELGARAGGGSGAVAKGVDSFLEELFTILNFHILVSIGCLVCYGIAVYTGRKLYKTGEGRSRHRKNAIVFIVMRLSSWVTSFMV
jgi:uncharacterized membrane protein YozB (DUF420 family)